MFKPTVSMGATFRTPTFRRPVFNKARSDEGTMPVVAALFVIAFMGCVSVVINQHQHLDALGLARETSFNAARAASQKLDEDVFFDENRPAVNSAEAIIAAEAIVADVPEASIETLDVEGDSITIVIAVKANGILTSKTFTGTGRASAIDPNG